MNGPPPFLPVRTTQGSENSPDSFFTVPEPIAAIALENKPSCTASRHGREPLL